MPHCAAFGCNFQSKGNKGSDVSLHSFPHDKQRRKEWENACGRVQLPKDPRLCSLHFSPDAFEAFSRPRLLKELTGAAGYKRRLKPNAVPTIFPHKDSKRRPRIATENRAKKRQRQERLDVLLLACKQAAPAAAAAERESSEGCARTMPIKEETDSQPVEAVKFTVRSISVQCSPSKTDAATQTDINKSDAALQWPACVQNPVTTDHTYPGKHDTELDKRVEEDNVSNSQDLFLSDDELGEQERRYSQSDPEYYDELEVTLSSDDAPSDEYESPEDEDEEEEMNNKKEDSSDEWEMPTEETFTDSEKSSLDEEEAESADFQDESNSLPVVGCKDCGSESTLQCSLLRHEKVFGCSQCGAGDGVVSHCFEKLVVLFNDFTSFQYHAKKEHGAVSKRILCPDCGVFFVIPTQINGKKEHVCDHKVKAFICPECNKRFSTEQGLKTHTRTVHSSSVHPCKYCLKPFWNRPSKLEHEQNHPKEDEPYSCTGCPEKFDDIVKRNRHLAVHRGPWKCVCKTCGKGFMNSEKLERHKLVHSGDKPFKCEVCERSFNQLGHLKSHLRVHTGEKPYKCKLCEKCFNHNISLKNHVQQYHHSEAPTGGAQVDSKTEKYRRRLSGRPRGRPKRADRR